MKGLNAHGSCAAQLSTCFKALDHAALSLHVGTRGPRLPVSACDKTPKTGDQNVDSTRLQLRNTGVDMSGTSMNRTTKVTGAYKTRNDTKRRHASGFSIE
jgi:hypothetical protein